MDVLPLCTIPGTSLVVNIREVLIATKSRNVPYIYGHTDISYTIYTWYQVCVC